MSPMATAAQLEQVAQRRAELVGGGLAHGGQAPVLDAARRPRRSRSGSGCCRRRRRAAHGKDIVGARLTPCRPRGPPRGPAPSVVTARRGRPRPSAPAAARLVRRPRSARQAPGLVLGDEGRAVGDRLQARVGDRRRETLGVRELEEAVLRRPCDQGRGLKCSSRAPRRSVSRLAIALRSFAASRRTPRWTEERPQPAIGDLVGDRPLGRPRRRRSAAGAGGACRSGPISS